jgi:hypothetical protein
MNLQTPNLQPGWIENGRRHFDRMVTGSNWCARILEASRLQGVSTAVHGIDDSFFFRKPGIKADEIF